MQQQLPNGYKHRVRTDGVSSRTALGKVREGTQPKRTRTEARQQTNNTSTTNRQQLDEQSMNVSDLGTNTCGLNELVVRSVDKHLIINYCRGESLS